MTHTQFCAEAQTFISWPPHFRAKRANECCRPGSALLSMRRHVKSCWYTLCAPTSAPSTKRNCLLAFLFCLGFLSEHVRFRLILPFQRDWSWYLRTWCRNTVLSQLTFCFLLFFFSVNIIFFPDVSSQVIQSICIFPRRLSIIALLSFLGHL